MIGHLRQPGAVVSEALDRRRAHLIGAHQTREHVVFADFILGDPNAEFGVLGFTGWKIFVYSGDGLLEGFDIPTLGLGSGGMWDEALNTFLGNASRVGNVNMETIRQWVRENTTPGACRAYYDAYRWENG